MPNLRMKGSNAVLRYGGNVASVRVSEASYSYSVTSTESHAREEKAFYPHRRALGQFTITIDAIGYKEFKSLMSWLTGYARSVSASQMGNSKGAVIMEVQMPSRKFHKYGILTEGISDHDNTASMVFSPQLKFMTLKDANDDATAIVSTGSTSQFIAPSSQANTITGAVVQKGKKAVAVHDTSGLSAFYPVTISSYKDTDAKLYDVVDKPIGDTLTDPTLPDKPSQAGGNYAI